MIFFFFFFFFFFFAFHFLGKEFVAPPPPPTFRRRATPLFPLEYRLSAGKPFPQKPRKCCLPETQAFWWYQEIEFLISRNIYHFLDIKNSVDFWISRIRFLDIKKYFLISNNISWYQEFISWYQVFHVLILRIHFLKSRKRIIDIKK